MGRRFPSIHHSAAGTMIDTTTTADAGAGTLCQALASNPLPAAITDSVGRLHCRNRSFDASFPTLDNFHQSDLISFLRSLCAADLRIDPGELLTVPSSSVVDLQLNDDRHLQVLVVPQFTGRQQLWLWEFRDVSTERLLRQQASHEERMGAVVRLAGGMAHEFNNLLTAVLGNLELIRTVPDRTVAQIGSNLEAAEAAALRASQLIDELRRFAGRHMSVPRLQVVAPVIKNVGEILTKMASPGVQISATVDPTVQYARARISSDALSEALLKIAACGLNEPLSCGRLRLNACQSDKLVNGQPVLQIDVQGLHRSILGDRPEFVFEPFQASSPSSLSSLSMAVAYSLVAEMDATMRVEDVGESEANVRIELPLIDYLPQPSVPAGREPQPSTDAVHASALEVAVVDNEPGIRSVGQGMLKHLGHLVTCFASGEELLKRVTAGASFDLILLDNAMPGLSGRSTYAQLRPLTNARVLISSGRPVQLQNYAPAEVPPPDGLLEKPFSLATLATVIAGLI